MPRKSLLLRHSGIRRTDTIQKETMIHVVKPHEAKHRNSFGVAFDLLAIGPQSMVTKMHYRKENVIPFHSHPNEQTGYILSGRICVLTRDSRHELDRKSVV